MATALKLKREIRLWTRGDDVKACKRALTRAGYGSQTLAKITSRFGPLAVRRLRQFQTAHQLKADGVVGAATLKALTPHMDAYARQLYKNYDPTFDALIQFMKRMSRDTPGYLLGGGHGKPLAQVKTTDKLDCSSSTALALDHVGLFPDERAWTSGKFQTSYGQPGKGRLFTVYANPEHVWIRLHQGRYWRFDTSPHGDGGRGPRLRILPRFTSGFSARHWPGF